MKKSKGIRRSTRRFSKIEKKINPVNLKYQTFDIGQIVRIFILKGQKKMNHSKRIQNKIGEVISTNKSNFSSCVRIQFPNSFKKISLKNLNFRTV